ncbi:hypothetical protein [Patiriisocius marinus]|uniref:hypothetical protein n=1 Tax=Patiriisocius marinus TaxID=1397112 RepID=UPI00232CDE04|nr:hypothetical protein [Patiriisocius marinus]
MTETNNSTRFKVLIGVLSALLIGLAIYTFTLFKDSKETISTIEKDKIEVQNELEDLIENYNEIILENESKDTQLLAARERIVMLLDSVKDSEANVALIRRYRGEIDKLKSERVVLFRRADSLKLANQRLSMERDSTTVMLNETIKVVDSVNISNQELTKTVEKAALLGITNLSGDAVIVRNSGKIVDTRRSSRADKIRACYTLAPNTIAQKGDRMLYVQVINPENNVIGVKETMSFANGDLTYSATTNVFYENEALDVCTLVTATEDELIEGRYVVTVFDQGRSLGSTIIELK